MGDSIRAPRRVAIIGAGIVGLSTAWWLARRGASVVVLDREPPGTGASAGNAGLLSIGHAPLTKPGASWRGLRWMASRRSPLYIRPTLDPRILAWLWSFHRHCNAAWSDRCLAALCRLGFPALEAFETIMREESIECDYARDGWLEIAASAESLRRAEQEARSLEPFGYSIAVLDGAALRRDHPVFRREIAGAVHYRDSARCHPGRFVDGLRAAIARRGAELRLDAAVAALEPRPRLASGETIDCDAVVIAAGAWSSELVESLGVRLPLVAARGYHLHYDSVPAMPGTGCVLRDSSVAITPMGSSLRLAGTLEIGPIGRPWMRERIQAIIDGAAAALDGVDRFGPAREWAGYRPCTPDGMPVVGEIRPEPRGVAPSGDAPASGGARPPRCFVGTGHAMMGMTLGPISGKLLAELVLDEPPSADLSLLAADRFGRCPRRTNR